MIRKVFAALVLLITWCYSATGQSQTDEAAVKAVIARLFEGMAKGDSAQVHSVFTHDVTMASVFRDKSNSPIFRKEDSIHEFLVAIGTPHPDPWYEETWNLSVRVDGDLAQVWCDYGLFVGNKFSHCGVDAFHLHKGTEGWKIFHLADTRRRENCQVPDDIKKKHMN